MPASCRECGGNKWTRQGTCETCQSFPTLGWVVAEWIEEMCVVPDRAAAGDPFVLSDEQFTHLLHQYRLNPRAKPDLDKPAAPFVYNGSLMVRSQKWGKGPFSAVRICAQAEGPVIFDGWDADGQPVGIAWATPHIQVAAVAEDQTDNIWRALKPMIELGPLAGVIETGWEGMKLAGGGLIEPVSSNATTRLGARLTYLEIDQPESMTKANGGDKLVDTLLRNVAPLGGRWSATGNAYDPAENSVEQTWIEKPTRDVFVDYPEPLAGSWSNKRERRRILKHAYKGSPWVDVNRVEAECERFDRKGDPAQAERFYGNRIVAGADKAFDIEAYKGLFCGPAIEIAKKQLVTLGFDGALTKDSTGLVATDVERGLQVVAGIWERPSDLPDDEPWMVDVDDVNEAVDHAFTYWDVWALWGDPPHWKDDLNRWAGQYGEDKVFLYWTNIRKRMAYALRGFKTDMRPGVMGYGGENFEALERHIANAVKRLTVMKDEDDGTPLWLISKDGHNSPRKIDLAMAACLSWEARGAAIRDGALKKTKYRSAAWQ